MKNLIGYIRCSSKEQQRGDTEQRQLKAIMAEATAQGLPVEIIRDIGESAYHGDHRKYGNLRTFLDQLERGEHSDSMMLVEDISRFSREDEIDATQLLIDVIRHIPLKSCLSQQVFKRGDRMSLIMFLIDQGGSRDYVEKLSKNVRAAYERKRERTATGEPWSRQCPYGFRVAIKAGCDTPEWSRIREKRRTAGTEYVFHEEEYQVVERIINMAAGMGGEQHIPYAIAIARELDKDGVPAPKSKHGWSPMVVKSIIYNDAYLDGSFPLHRGTNGKRGKKRVATGEVVTGLFPTRIDPEIIRKARASLTRGKTRSTPHIAKDSNLLTGIAFCAQCGETMHRYGCKGPGGDWMVLRCRTIRKNRHAHEVVHHLQQRDIEGSLLLVLASRLDPDRIAASLDRGVGKEAEKRQEVVDRQIKDLRKEIKTLDDAILKIAAGPTAVEYGRRADAARAELEKLIREKAAIEAERRANGGQRETIAHHCRTIGSLASLAVDGHVIVSVDEEAWQSKSMEEIVEAVHDVAEQPVPVEEVRMRMKRAIRELVTRIDLCGLTRAMKITLIDGSVIEECVWSMPTGGDDLVHYE